MGRKCCYIGKAAETAEAAVYLWLWMRKNVEIIKPPFEYEIKFARSLLLCKITMHEVCWYTSLKRYKMYVMNTRLCIKFSRERKRVKPHMNVMKW
jgi:hypothetical protein